jgi:putative flippase GtrA
MIFSKFFDRIFLKFILAGIINTVIGSAIMFAFYNAAHWGYWLSSATSYTAGSVVSFFLNKYFTFNVRHWSVFMIIAFIANICVCYAAAYGVAKPAMNYFLKNTPHIVRENTALFTGMCLFTVLNYIGQRLFVFRRKMSENV